MSTVGCKMSLIWAVMVAAVLLAGLALHPWPDERQPLFDAVLVLQPGQSVRQPVRLIRPGLVRVDLALTREGEVGGRLSLRVEGGADGEVELAAAEVAARAAENVDYPIRRPYGYVSFRLPVVEAVGPVRLHFESRANGPIGVRRLGEELTHRLYYHRSLLENFGLFVERLTDRGPCPTAWPYGVLLVVYALIVSRLFVGG